MNWKYKIKKQNGWWSWTAAKQNKAPYETNLSESVRKNREPPNSSHFAQQNKHKTFERDTEIFTTIKSDAIIDIDRLLTQFVTVRMQTQKQRIVSNKLTEEKTKGLTHTHSQFLMTHHLRNDSENETEDSEKEVETEE